MSKYIDADKLIAEIERYENTAIDAYNPHEEDADFWHGKVVACEDLKTIVTSLQQKQPEVDVDLEKEIETWIPKHVRSGAGEWKECRDAVIECGGIVARHFYDLGLNARKEN